jgi:hypothetical protein
MKPVGTLISIGQAAGLAAACGLVALIPIGIGALAAALGLLHGAVRAYDDRPLVIASVLAAVAGVAAAVLLPSRLRLPLAAVAGGVVFELATGHRLPWAGLAIGAAIGAGAAFALRTVVEGAAQRGGTRAGVAAVASVAAAVAGALAIVPFVGYLLVAAVAWLGLRARRAATQKYAGLRVLR